jgi:hypothetical protein
MKARTKSTIVALDRSMIALVKELRESRKRPLAKWAQDAQRAEAAAAEAASAAAQDEAETVDEPSPFEIAPEISRPAETDSQPGVAEPVKPQPAIVVPVPAQDRTPVVPSRRKGLAAGTSQPDEADEPTFEEIMAASQEALAAAEETLAETRALSGVQMAASGD